MSLHYACDVCGVDVPEAEVSILKATAGRLKKKKPATHLCGVHTDALLTFFQPPQSPGSGKAARTSPKGPAPRQRPSAN